jgi:hypothetical protein
MGERFRPTLIPRCLHARSDVTDAPPRSPPEPVALMLFTPDDDFHDDARTWNLPDCAVALLARAGSWSARNQRDGFVPTAMLARFSSDPVQAAEELTRRGLWRRVRRGYHFTDWERWGETAEAAERKQAEADRRKELAAERQRRKREKDRERAGTVTRDSVRDDASDLPEAVPTSRGRHAPVTQPGRTTAKKPQVNGGAVTRDSGVTGSVTPPSDDLDLDFDLSNQSGVVNQVEDRNAGAGAREKPAEPDPYTPEFRLQVQGFMAARDHDDVTDAEADGITTEVLGRSKEPVPHPLGYIRRAVTREKNPYARWLSRRVPAPAVILAEFRPATGPHDFERNPETGGCTRCREPEQDKIHKPRRRAVS